jgi:hypothetical protein
MFELSWDEWKLQNSSNVSLAAVCQNPLTLMIPKGKKRGNSRAAREGGPRKQQALPASPATVPTLIRRQLEYSIVHVNLFLTNFTEWKYLFFVPVVLIETSSKTKNGLAPSLVTVTALGSGITFSPRSRALGGGLTSFSHPSFQ